MRTQLTTAVLVMVCAVAFVGCSAAPRQRPVEMGPVNTGSGSVEAARRELQGLWDLVSLETFPTPGGSPVPVAAVAVLSYDEYGNLRMKGRRTGDTPTESAAAPLLDYEGQAIIDHRKHELHLMDVSSNRPALEVRPELSHKLVRKYTIEGDLLKVSTIDQQGNVTATAVWKRRPPQ